MRLLPFFPELLAKLTGYALRAASSSSGGWRRRRQKRRRQEEERHLQHDFVFSFAYALVACNLRTVSLSLRPELLSLTARVASFRSHRSTRSNPVTSRWRVLFHAKLESHGHAAAPPPRVAPRWARRLSSSTSPPYSSSPSLHRTPASTSNSIAKSQSGTRNSSLKAYKDTTEIHAAFRQTRNL